MNVVIRSYSGEDAKQVFDLIEERFVFGHTDLCGNVSLTQG